MALDTKEAEHEFGETIEVIGAGTSPDGIYTPHEGYERPNSGSVPVTGTPDAGSPVPTPPPAQPLIPLPFKTDKKWIGKGDPNRAIAKVETAKFKITVKGKEVEIEAKVKLNDKNQIVEIEYEGRQSLEMRSYAFMGRVYSSSSAWVEFSGTQTNPYESWDEGLQGSYSKIDNNGLLHKYPIKIGQQNVIDAQGTMAWIDIMHADQTNFEAQAGVSAIIWGNDLGNGMMGSHLADQLNGGAGDDRLYGRDGDDLLNGGAGYDYVNGEAGNDVILGEDGNDELYGGAGDDAISGGMGDDRIYGEDGNDELYGEAGNDIIWGGAGHDVAYGGDGNDFIGGEAGNDYLYGGLGNDVIWAGTGDDTVDGGEGDDFISGEDGNDTVLGGAGNDTLFGYYGDDVIYGGDGHDQLAGEWGNDMLYGGNGNDTIFGGDGNDMVSGDEGNDNIWGGAGDDNIWGGNGNDMLRGNAGNDRLTGGAGADMFIFDWDAPLNSATNVDTITDFTHGEDKLWLASNIFGAMGGPLGQAGGTITLTQGTSALGSKAQLIYDRASGDLWYDADGVGGQNAIKFSHLSNHAELSASDFFLF